MLPDKMRKELAEKVEGYFGNDDKYLRDAALRLQDDGYADTEVLNILKAAYYAGHEAGYEAGYEVGYFEGSGSGAY